MATVFPSVSPSSLPTPPKLFYLTRATKSKPQRAPVEVKRSVRGVDAEQAITHRPVHAEGTRFVLVTTFVCYARRLDALRIDG